MLGSFNFVTNDSMLLLFTATRVSDLTTGDYLQSSWNTMGSHKCDQQVAGMWQVYALGNNLVKSIDLPDNILDYHFLITQWLSQNHQY